MNIVDKNFYELINLLKQMNTEEIYENIQQTELNTILD